MAKAKPKGPGGRPTIYTTEIGKEICHLLSTTSMTLKMICESDDKFPADPRTIYRWVLDNQEFSQMYTLARQAQADVRADSTHDIAWECLKDQDVDVNKARLVIDTIKWHTSKVLPKVYGNNETKNINVNKHEQRLDLIGDE